MKKVIIQVVISTFFLSFHSVNAQWVQTNWLNNGEFRTFAVSPSGDIFAGTNHGVYKAYNNATCWNEVNAGIENVTVNSLAINSNGEIFAGTDDGVYMSADSGKKWKAINTGLPVGNWHDSYGNAKKLTIQSLTINGTGEIFVAVDSLVIPDFATGFAHKYNIYKSNNNGNYWTLVNSSIPMKAKITNIHTNGKNILVQTDRNIYYSKDNGTTLTVIKGSYLGADYGINDSTIFYAIGGSYGGVFRTTDYGTNWTKISGEMGSYPTGVHGMVTYNFDGLAVNDSIIFTEANGILYQSVNSGKTWKSSFYIPNQGPFGRFVRGGYNIYAMVSYAYDSSGSVKGPFIYQSTDNGTSWNTVSPDIKMFNIYSFFSSAEIDSNFFVATDSGVFVSINHGMNWTKVNSGLSSPIKTLAVIGNNIFAGSKDGVYLSANNGTTWTSVNAGLPSNISINSLAVGNTGELFAGTDSGLFISTDKGTSWKEIILGEPLNSRINTFTTSDSLIYAATQRGIILSTNSGQTWSKLNNGLSDTIVNSLALGSNGHIFAGTNSGVFLSTDNGSTWKKSSIGLTDTIRALTISDNNIFAGTSSGTYLSTDNGTSWALLKTGLTNTTAISLFSSGSIIFAGTNNGVFQSSNNGKNWYSTNGFQSPNVNTFAIKDSLVFAGTEDGVFLSTNRVKNWTAANRQIRNNKINAIAFSGNNIFAGSDSGVYLSTNEGASWISVNTGLTKNRVSSLALIDSNIFAVAEGSLFRSTNNGTNWTMDNSILASSIVRVIAANKNNLFAGTNHGVFRSINKGINWTIVDSGIFVPTDVYSLAVNETAIFAGEQACVYRSTDNGSSWTAVNTGLTNIVNNLYVNTNNIFAVTRSGVFLSTTNGARWASVNTGLPANTNVTSLATLSTGEVLAGTAGAGIWYRPLSEMISLGKIEPLPLVSQQANFVSILYSFANSHATIALYLPHSEKVKIGVYNVNGCQIASLENKILMAGLHNIPWDTRNVAAGPYLIKIEAGNNVFVRKISILK